MLDDASVNSDNALDVGQARAWYKSKKAFIAFTLLTIAIIAIIMGISLYQANPPTGNLANLVSFACRQSSENQTFTVTVEINLRDGMDQDEAIRVATKAYERNMLKSARPPTESNSSAYMREDGTWTVKFHMVHLTYASYCSTRQGFVRRELHEYFEAVINPFVRTVMYASV